LSITYSIVCNRGKHRIEVRFPFSWGIVERLRKMPDGGFEKKSKCWHFPYTKFHAVRLTEALKEWNFYVDPYVQYLLKEEYEEPPQYVPDSRLFGFQRLGVEFLLRSARGGGAILADEMGLGKTPQALCYMDYVKYKTIVIAPANVIWKWKRECETWTSMSADVISTTKEPLTDAQIHIMSYEIMTRRQEELWNAGYAQAVFDEAHRLSNPKSLRTKAAKALSKYTRHVLFLSGTPFLNRPSEMFPMLNMIDPICYPSYYKFLRRYTGAEWRNGLGWYFPPFSLTNKEELKERLQDVMLRRTKREVLHELPGKSRVIVPVEIPLGDYRQARKEFTSWYKTNKIAGTSSILAKMTAMRQVVGMAKVDAVVSLAKDILQGNEQVVIFCHHLSVVQSIKEALSDYRVGVIQGSVSAKDRSDICDMFQSGDMDVIIMTLAGAEGIDLYSANNIIFAEREWVPAKEEQAEDRLNRIGQKNAVTCWYVTAKGTMDERLALVVQSKRDVFGAVMKQDEIFQTVMGEFEEEVGTKIVQK